MTNNQFNNPNPPNPDEAARARARADDAVRATRAKADAEADKQDSPEEHEARIAKERKAIPLHEAAIVEEAQKESKNKKLLHSHLLRYSNVDAPAGAGEEKIYCPEAGVYAYFD